MVLIDADKTRPTHRPFARKPSFSSDSFGLRRLGDSAAGLLIRTAFIFNACFMCFGCFTTLSDSAAGHVPSIRPAGGMQEA